MRLITHTTISWLAALALLFMSAQPSLAQRGFGGFSGGGFGGGGFSGGGFSGGGYGRSSSSSSSTSTDGSKPMGTAIVQYDQDTGSLIVITDDDTNERIKKVVESLDRPIPQVLIKVLFLEVTHTDDLDLGVEASYKNLNSKDGTEYNMLQSVFGLANETKGGFYKILDDDFAATIRALATSTKLEVLSRPSVLARNNVESVITVGESVPFITNSQITDQGNTINTIQYSDVGIILRVTPHIAPDRMVEMEVHPEISTLTAETVPITDTVGARVIAKRSADSRVLVGDGKTVVIGGMMANNNNEEVSKIPFLGDIPYVGALFRRTVSSKTKTELLIFLTPLVVGNPEEYHQVSRAEQKNNEVSQKALPRSDFDKFLNNVKAEEKGYRPGKAGAAAETQPKVMTPAPKPGVPQVLYEESPRPATGGRQ